MNQPEPEEAAAASASNYALAHGMAHTRATLELWRADPWPVLRRWFTGSTLIAVGLLVAVAVVASQREPDPMTGVLPGVVSPAGFGDVVHTITRNSLVLALHSMACVAGFIAGTTMPLEARNRGGAWGAVHDYAGRFAILFVTGATTFSLLTQAFVLGGLTSDMSARLGLHHAELIMLLLPHALPELIGLFLPLAAWLIASRHDEWHQLLAATVVTTAIAAPIVLTSAIIEVYVTPEIIRAYAF